MVSIQSACAARREAACTNSGPEDFDRGCRRGLVLNFGLRPEPDIRQRRSIPMDPRPLLIFLEAPYAAYQGSLPARLVVLAGLGFQSDYWICLAVGWLEQGAPLDDEIVEMLNRVAETHHYEQRIRHRSAALARRWVREGA